MAVKVTFDPTVYEIIVTQAPTGGIVAIDFQVDVYSDGKEDWTDTISLARFSYPISAVGGEPLPGGLTLDPVFFIAAPWKIRPYDADHELSITGNVFTTDGSAAVLGRPGRTITVRLNSTFSAGARVVDIAGAVHGDGRSLTVGKFIALK